ncbi:RNA polymerase sigma factor [Lysinibacter cavernae]|uniref:RNA polymerase sigma factor (Sigma-70 family) n=1 Tax=Lysinibacter cavernae TaxID=1640652 RepID=A0A7X5R009_9MICO|nr:RNA polymerase sigma factor [Lysinibacter cavernae]NIH53133.1 RNA polymerase sigma factor (sigma-70 family) [Lysinibacter cavernae]
MAGIPFEVVVHENSLTVLRVCRAVVGVQDADEAWSETFLSALLAYPSLPADANVQAWLVTIAHRKAIDILRAASRRALPAEPSEFALLPSVIGNPDALPLDLQRYVAELPERQRLAVAYHHIAGLPYAEVAQLVGGSEAAARRAGADGVTALRRRFLQDEGEDHE